jgi:hypothetical protein
MKLILLAVIALAAFAETKQLPPAEYNRVRAAENAKIAAQRKLRAPRTDPTIHADLVKAAEVATANYRKVFKSVEAAHPGYLLQPERLVLIKLE